jgi:hypothetical protein
MTPALQFPSMDPLPFHSAGSLGFLAGDRRAQMVNQKDYCTLTIALHRP